LRFVFDTNVLVSAALLPSSKPRLVLDLALKQGRLLLSFPVLAELCEVLNREKFRRYLDEEDVRTFVAVLTRESEWIDIDKRITVCRDPKDDKLLELAVSGRATCIVSGDSDLLALNPFQGIAIMTPQAFLKE
jgi:uncharacterized protein